MTEPWLTEPNELSWTDERTGLPCRIKRAPGMGHLCGYVGVPPTHAYFGWHYDDHIIMRPEDKEGTVDDVGVMTLMCYALGDGDKHGTIPIGMTLHVHGGITWAGALPWDDSDPNWFWGFDCGHAGDLMPDMQEFLRGLERQRWVYRDIEYVKKEVTSLAFQLRQYEARVLTEKETTA